MRAITADVLAHGTLVALVTALSFSNGVVAIELLVCGIGAWFVGVRLRGWRRVVLPCLFAYGLGVATVVVGVYAGLGRHIGPTSPDLWEFAYTFGAVMAFPTILWWLSYCWWSAFWAAHRAKRAPSVNA